MKGKGCLVVLIALIGLVLTGCEGGSPAGPSLIDTENRDTKAIKSTLSTADTIVGLYEDGTYFIKQKIIQGVNSNFCASKNWILKGSFADKPEEMWQNDFQVSFVEDNQIVFDNLPSLGGIYESWVIQHEEEGIWPSGSKFEVKSSDLDPKAGANDKVYAVGVNQSELVFVESNLWNWIVRFKRVGDTVSLELNLFYGRIPPEDGWLVGEMEHWEMVYRLIPTGELGEVSCSFEPGEIRENKPYFFQARNSAGDRWMWLGQAYDYIQTGYEVAGSEFILYRSENDQVFGFKLQGEDFRPLENDERE